MRLNSKTLKPKKFRWQWEDETKSFWGNVWYQIQKYLYWPVTDNYRIYSERLKRSWAYARFGWLNYDFDMSCAYGLFEFKLKRLHKSLGKGCSIQEPQDMDALKELIKVVRRLRIGNHDRKYHRRHNNKWGRLLTRSTPNHDENGKVKTYTWHAWREKCPENAPKKLQNKEMKEFRACYEMGEKDRVKDLERMAELLVKHANSWWD